MTTKNAETIRAASNAIQSGAWQLLNTEVVNISNIYAVQQYRDTRGFVQTVGLTREGNVVTVAI